MRFSLLFAAAICCVTVSLGQIPRTLSYQGLLTDSLGNPFPDGSYSVTFQLYQTSSGGSAIWQEGKLVQVVRGVFSTTLGDVAPISLPFDVQYWLGVQVGSNPELSPRMKLGAAGYSIRAISAEAADATGLADSSRIAGTIPNGAVTTVKIQNGAVTQAKLASGISLPPGGSAGGDLTGTYPDPVIADGSVTTAKILDATITAADLANNAVTSAKLANSSVTTQKINSSGASTGQALTYNGTSVAWGNPNGGLALPFSGSASVSAGPAVLDISNTAGTGGVPAIRAMSTDGFGIALQGIASGSLGASGVSGEGGTGVYGKSVSLTGTGVYGEATNDYGTGVYGKSTSPNGTGVVGFASAMTGATYGVYGATSSTSGRGVIGVATTSSGTTYGVTGQSSSTSGRGILGQALATSGTNWGVYGETLSPLGFGVAGYTLPSNALGAGVYGSTTSGTGYGVFSSGNLGATGTKSFSIDHPTDPSNKYLNHYCTEGPEPYNVYSGNIALDAEGSATVELPSYFEEINKNFRYQLTPIGAPAPNLFVAEKITGNHFRIAGGTAGLEVSWRVDAVRNDLWVRTHGAPVEIAKPAGQQGKYLHPELYGHPREMGIHYSAPHNQDALLRPAPEPPRADFSSRKEQQQ